MRYVLGLLIVLCASCGQELDVEYGATRTQSINGLSVFKSYWKDRFQIRSHRHRTERLDDHDLITHVVEGTTFNLFAQVDLNDLPEDMEDIDKRSPQAWINDWLGEQSQRQFVLILRDGNLAPQLCAQWAKEFETAAADKDKKSGAGAGDAFREQARYLNEIARKEQYAPIASPDQSLDFHFFTLHGVEEKNAESISGILAGEAPHTMRTRSHLYFRGSNVLIKADERNFALSIPHKNSRLIVIANATPFLDAALVDKQARAMLQAITDEVANWKPKKSAWLGSLSAASAEPPPPPNILIQLFTKEPFNYVIIHALAFLIFFLLWRSSWLGRRQSRRRKVAEEFHQHIDALARHLQRSGKTRKQCQAIAKALHKDSDDLPMIQSDAEAIHYIQQLYQQDDTKGEA